MTAQLPANSPLVAAPANQTQYTPDQIHVTMAREWRLQAVACNSRWIDDQQDSLCMHACAPV